MTRYTAAAALLVLMAAAGCTESPEMTDSDWIEELVANSSLAETSDLDGTGDPSDGKDPQVGLPEVWYRELLAEPSPRILLENDPSAGVCTVTVIHDISAQLLIDTLHDGIFDPGFKPIADSRYVRLVAVKDEDQEENGGWSIASVTPAEHMLSGQGQQVFITSMTIYSGDEQIWSCTDPGTFYDVASGLPRISEGDLVRLEATVNHIDPQYDPPCFVVAHGPLPVHSRHMMFDNGLYGDRVAGDGVFTYQWYAEYTCSRNRIAVDVIDADTFADQTQDDYDAGAWGIHFSD